MGASAPAIVLQRRAVRRRQVEMFRAAADSGGLTVLTEQQSFMEGTTFHCLAGDLEVALHCLPFGRIVVKPLDATAGLRLRVQERTSVFGAPEVEIGDAAFDQGFLIEGPTARAFAVLDVETRRLLRAAMSGGDAAYAGSRSLGILGRARLEGGELSVDLHPAESADDLAAALRTVLRAATRLAGPRDIPESLARNAVMEPLPEVRLGNLKTLVREFPDHAAAGPALRRCCEDSEDEIRFCAARALREGGWETLFGLAFGGPWPQRPAAAEPVAARAVAALGAALPADRALQELGAMLERRRLETACACIYSLALEGRGASVTGCEDALIRALSHDHGDVRAAAARALGSVGSVAAVMPLCDAAERFAGDTPSAARGAVAQIQARLRGAAPGQVSLASSAGELSLAESGGALSLPGPD